MYIAYTKKKISRVDVSCIKVHFDYQNHLLRLQFIDPVAWFVFVRVRPKHRIKICCS